LNQSKQELVEFLKERSIFKVLDERVLGGICQLFQEVECGPGHVIFKQGEEADAIYVIKEGSVEVLQGTPPKVIAYLTSGDTFGEMALFNDTTRNATIRVPEEALILKLPRKAFNELQNYFPEVTKEVTAIINRRQAGKVPLNAPGLQGNLAFFDLPTVIQTVIGSRQIGVLTLRGRGGKVVAQVHVRQGKLTHASFAQLTGDAAIYELLTRNEPLDFIFEQQRELDSNAPTDKVLMSKQPHMVLIEGARRADELPRLTQTLGWPDQSFQQAIAQPDWNKLSEEVAAAGRKIWLLLEVGLNLQQLSEKLSNDRFTLLSAIDEMSKAAMIRRREDVNTSTAMTLVMHAPAHIASMLTAFNLATQNLGEILGSDVIRAVLSSALEESTERYSFLSSLKTHPETATLDLRLAAPEISQSQDSVKALEELTYTFLRKVAERHAPVGRV
jgi:hypothetical protein